MKHTKMIRRPAMVATDIEITDFISCDICDQKIESSVYDAFEIVIKHKTGSNYPEGGSGNVTWTDLCEICFGSKLIPWLESEGVTLQTESWEWDY